MAPDRSASRSQDRRLPDLKLILALDFDGVLHPRVTKDEPLFCRVPLLENWLRSHAEVQVVISSSWREVNTIYAMRDRFSEDVRNRFVGVTPFAHRILGQAWTRTPAEMQAARYARQYEIEAWCADTGYRDWIALDDDPRLFEPDCQRLCLVDHQRGLTTGVMEELTRMLERFNPGG